MQNESKSVGWLNLAVRFCGMAEWSTTRGEQELPARASRRETEERFRKGGHAVTARSADSAITGLRASGVDEIQEQPRTGNFLYQGATILAILLFFISFWSC